MKISKQEIESKQTERGGYTRDQLAKWGIPWPPPKGWKEKLISGTDLPHPFKCSKCTYIASSAADSRKHWFEEH